MVLEKSLLERLQAVYPKAFDLVYHKNGDAREVTGLPSETESLLWDFIDGIGSYIDRVLSGRMSIAESLKDHMAIIESRILAVEKTTRDIP